MCCFFKQKTAYELRISDWSSDVCSSDLDQAPCIDPWVEALRQHQGELTDVISRSHARLSQPTASAEINIRPKLVFSALLLGVAASKIGRASCRERVCQYV